MQINKYDLAVLIGRFEPWHIGHYSNLKYTIENCSRNILIVVGSSFQPRTIKNPFTFDERKSMIEASINEIDPTVTCTIVPQRDYFYEETKWVHEIQTKIQDAYKSFGYMDLITETSQGKNICLVGHDKDKSSYYLSLFPSYSVVDPGGFVTLGDRKLNATQIREMLFNQGPLFAKSAVPESTYQIITDFVNTAEHKSLVKEYEFIQRYKQQWENSPYPPSFNTVDAVVVQGGHILLVKRLAEPGRGLWALPGGFVDPDETLETAMIRELKEETRISVPLPIIKSNITHRRQFDHPKRSLRGRTFSEAFLIELPLDHQCQLARVKGSDDAEKAQWFTISEALGMSEQLFEDHHSIISMLVARAK
jgi:bifunctional NMN adenylyltransferase/nudix hydrolase